MDIFGERWSNYMQKIKDNWQKTVGEDDFVIVPGDVPGPLILNRPWKILSLLMSFREKNNFKRQPRLLVDHYEQA